MFRLIFTWYPIPPDPQYWKYYRIDGIIVPLYNLIDPKRTAYRLRTLMTTYGIKRVTGLDALLLVDSQAAPVKKGVSDLRYTQKDALMLQDILGADILVQRDYPLLKYPRNLWEKLIRKNLRNASHALRLADKIGKPVILVVHGWDPASYAAMARKYLDLGASHIGIGSLLMFTRVRDQCAIIQRVREEVGQSVYIHAFGVFSRVITKCLLRNADSADVSTPVKVAAMRELILYRNGKLERIRLSTPDGPGILRRLRENGDPIERELAQLAFESKTFKRLKDTLALINAYEMLKAVRQGVK